MIALNSDSSIIGETLKLSQSSPVNKLEKVDIVFEDHSGGHYHLYCSNGSAGKEMRLAARLPAWKEIGKDSELVEMIKKEFEGLWAGKDDGFDVTIACSIEKLTEEIIESKFAQLKQKIVSIPLARALKQIDSKSSGGAPFTTSLGNNNQDFYSVVLQGDQIIVLFGMNFEDQTDTILAKVFLQEFYDTRNNRMEDAPVVLFGKEPPKELSKSGFKESPTLNYLTLVLFPRHYGSQDAKDHLLKTLPFLSDYLHYHLKCSKAYLHQRMRAKTSDFLKILNRAKPENF